MDNKIQFQELDPEKITETIQSVSERINDRFPNAGLFHVSVKLLEIVRRAKSQAEWISRPIMGLRITIGILIAIIIAALVGVLVSLTSPTKTIGLLEFIQALEAGINDAVLVGIAIFFLVSIEKRLKRHRALQAIHELRAIAHIIDMHQLTKDPDRLHWESVGAIAPRENARKKFTPIELTRYLDYCSEMLSLVGKVSVLYVQKFDDPVALSAVNEVEHLTTALSRKIWQKLMIIHRNVDEPGR